MEDPCASTPGALSPARSDASCPDSLAVSVETIEVSEGVLGLRRFRTRAITPTMNAATTSRPAKTMPIIRPMDLTLEATETLRIALVT